MICNGYIVNKMNSTHVYYYNPTSRFQGVISQLLLASKMTDPQLRQVKDFLGVFNRISETCFNTCVNSFLDRTTTDEEIQCLDRCVSKYLGLNHKLMEVYVEIQPEIIQRRMNELSNLNEQAPTEETVKSNEVPVN